jgi:hypothetical protein
LSIKDELVRTLLDSDQLGCGCCADSREISTGPEDWEVDYLYRPEALADDILAKFDLTEKASPPIPKTPDEIAAFAKAWDAKVDADRAKAGN